MQSLLIQNKFNSVHGIWEEVHHEFSHVVEVGSGLLSGCVRLHGIRPLVGLDILVAFPKHFVINAAEDVVCVLVADFHDSLFFRPNIGNNYIINYLLLQFSLKESLGEEVTFIRIVWPFYILLPEAVCKLEELN